MKNNLLFIVLLNVLLFSSIKSMEPEQPHGVRLPESASDFKKLPRDVKIEIINKIIEGPSIIAALNDLNRVKLIDNEFSKIVKNLHIIPALKPFFEFLKVTKSNNIFTILNFLKQESNQKLLLYRDLADYLHSKFFYILEAGRDKILYLSTVAIQAGLDLCNSKKFNEFKDSVKNIQEEFISRVRYDDIPRILQLLFVGANPNISVANISLLSYIIERAELKYVKVKLFLDKGAKIGPEDLSRVVTLHNLPLAELLLQHGANPNAFVENGNAEPRNPLQLAFNMRNIPMLALLLNYGAWPDIALSNGVIPLLNAAALKNKKIIEVLLDYGADTSDDFLQGQLEDIENSNLNPQELAEWQEAYTFMMDAIREYKAQYPLSEDEE